MRETVIAIPWGHHVNLLAKIERPAQRLLPASHGALWLEPRRAAEPDQGTGLQAIAGRGEEHNFPTALPVHPAEQAEEALKSSYNLQFLNIRQQVKERGKRGLKALLHGEGRISTIDWIVRARDGVHQAPPCTPCSSNPLCVDLYGERLRRLTLLPAGSVAAEGLGTTFASQLGYKFGCSKMVQTAISAKASSPAPGAAGALGYGLNVLFLPVERKIVHRSGR